MPYTFGAATTNRINWGASANSWGTSDRAGLVCGWWRPTTLTATRGLWSAGTTIGAEIDTTTDELRLRTDNTTDGQWTTAGVDLVVDQWKFIAMLLHTFNTGPTNNWRVWAGDEMTAPQPATVTVATAPVGNNTANSTLYVGNKGTGSLAFQGDIADVTFITPGVAVGVNNPFGLATAGTISDAEAQFIYEALVLPIWLGETIPAVNRLPNGSLAGVHSSLDFGAPLIGFGRTVSDVPRPSVAATITGAASSANGAPRPNVGMEALPRSRR